MADFRKQTDFTELVLLAMSGEATPQQMEQIDHILKTGPKMVSVYVTLLDLCTELSAVGSIEISSKTSEVADYDLFWQLLSEEEKTAPTIEIPEEEPQPELIQRVVHPPKKKREISRFSIFSLAMSVAAMVFFFLFLKFAPPNYIEVATITDSMDAQWSSALSLHPGTRMLTNTEPIRLTQGVVEFITDDQVHMVVEAPAEFRFSSYSEVAMNYGRLFAHVSPQGAGFSVLTPNSKIVDLGTEFGVLARIDGGTEVHLYEGKANLFAGQKKSRKTSQLLTAGLARIVDPIKSQVKEIALDEEALIRNIDSKSNFVWKGRKALRLTDLLLGGDGFGTASIQSIEYDPTSGETASPGESGYYRKGNGKLIGVPESPYLDALFIPGSEDGDVIISSAGHRFEGCPATSGLFFSNIICHKSRPFFGSVQQTFERSAKQFAESGSLYLHSNMGVTVDLDAIRGKVPGLRITSFSAFAGIMNMWDNEGVEDYAEVDVCVLVDGQLRSSRRKLRADEGYDIHIDLADTDRFLTLVVTDGGTIYSDSDPANHFDTCGFAEPVFELDLK